MPIEYVFLDNGGVITDNTRRGPQYRRLAGQYFVAHFGGTQGLWEDANVRIWPVAWQRFLARVENWHAGRDILHEVWLHDLDWMRSMLAAGGIQSSESDDVLAAQGKAIDDWINPQIDARFPGVDDAIEALAGRYRLFTASDGFEAALAAALGPSHERFERLYGPDLVNVPKSAGRAYYDAVFAHAKVTPAQALVVDDNVANIHAAAATGSRTVLVSAIDEPGYGGPRITNLPELLYIVDKL